MEKAIDKLRALWEAGEYRAALKLAASWPRLGEHGNAITLGWAAISNESFYRQLGKDVDYLYKQGLDAVAKRYGFTPAKDSM